MSWNFAGVPTNTSTNWSRHFTIKNTLFKSVLEDYKINDNKFIEFIYIYKEFCQGTILEQK